MMQLLIATHNRGKLREYQEILDGLPFELVTLDDVNIQDDVEETGTTFEENALLKAFTYAQQSGLLTLADDSGLEVDALGGEPGVYSKRYAGEGKTDAERNAYLLEKMRDLPKEKRAARFRCVIVIADGQPFYETIKGRAKVSVSKVWQAEGICEGEIAFAPRGTNGFGYDPIFIVRGGKKHLAEFSAQEKNKISHRGRAAEHARAALEKIARQ